MREENAGWGGEGARWAVSPPPHVMLIGAQAHSDAAAERGVWGSDVTKWDQASFSPHKAAVSHYEKKESGTSSVSHVRADILHSPPHAHMSHSETPATQCVPSAPTPLPI